MDVLISGASTGIGHASATQLARKGHTVWAGVRDQRAADTLSRLGLENLKPIFLDVTSKDSIEKCLSTIKKSSGLLHGLVNNAGIVVGGPLEAVTLDDLRLQFEVNVLGAHHLTQVFLPLLRESKGRIVNMSSISGKVASPFLGPYAASKFALEALSDSLRRELAPHGVRVAVVEPGPIATPIWEKSKSVGLDRSSKYSAEILNVYGNSLNKFREYIEGVTRRAAPVSIVVRAVEHALTSRSPRTRYPVGRGIASASVVSALLPDRLLDLAFR